MVEKDGASTSYSNGSLWVCSRTDILRTLHGDGTQRESMRCCTSDGGAWYDNCYELLIRRLRCVLYLSWR